VRSMRLSLWLAGLTLVGCGGNSLGPSPDEYHPDGFSAYSGARSDAVPPTPLRTDSDASNRLAAQMDKQDPRWSDREWREQRRSERAEDARRERQRKRRVEEQRQKRAAALEAHGGY
jgi:hypothetical protein